MLSFQIRVFDILFALRKCLRMAHNDFYILDLRPFFCDEIVRDRNVDDLVDVKVARKIKSITSPTSPA